MDLQVPYDWDGLRQLCRVLRSPQGCSWDRAQTAATLTPYLLEETHELLEAITSGDDRRTAEEMGDLLYLVACVLSIAEERGAFTFGDVARGIIEKMVRRHPHVFGAAPRDLSAARANEQWERIKTAEAEPAHPDRGRLRTGASGLPTLLEAYRVQEKAASLGFDWPDAEGVLAKLDEEVAELDQARSAGDAEQLAEEIGDLLFTLVNLARHLSADPEQALRRATRKFRDRFARMEALLEREGPGLTNADLDAMEAAWQRAKREP